MNVKNILIENREFLPKKTTSKKHKEYDKPRSSL